MTANYKVVKEGGVTVKGTDYSEGHVFGLNEEQVENDVFKPLIEDGSIVAEGEDAGSITAPVPAEDSADEGPKDDAASSDASGEATDAANTEGAGLGAAPSEESAG